MNHNESPHRRYNPLTGEWVMVSPHRTKRPWQGKEERLAKISTPEHDTNCYLCPGNKRSGGKVNPNYDSTYVFTNDFAALLPDTPYSDSNLDGLFQEESIRGTCRVICFSPNHNLTISKMDVTDIFNVINTWSDQVTELGKIYKWVQVFENKGNIMGCSNSHPHGQIWASTSLPNEPYKEDKHQHEYYKKNKSVLLMDYIKREIELIKRIIMQNEDWIVLVPFWAIWPFETILIPKRHVIRINELSESEKKSLAELLKRFLAKYDNLFNVSFPYSMGWHGAPFDNKENDHWQLHAHFYPPLLRSATIKKFMVGYEMLSEAQRDITAEQAAVRLRDVADNF